MTTSLTGGPGMNDNLPAGTRVCVLDRGRSMQGVVRYAGPSCEEDGRPTYRVRFDDGTETVICSTVLVPLGRASGRSTALNRIARDLPMIGADLARMMVEQGIPAATSVQGDAYYPTVSMTLNYGAGLPPLRVRMSIEEPETDAPGAPS